MVKQVCGQVQLLSKDTQKMRQLDVSIPIGLLQPKVPHISHEPPNPYLTQESDNRDVSKS